MENRLNKLLTELGLDSLECQVYLATLRLGGGNATEISKQVRENRVTIYEVLKRLMRKGYVRLQPGKRKNGKHFICIEFESIVEKLRERQQNIGHLLDGAEAMGLALHGLYAQSDEKPSVFFYEGVTGIQDILKDTLRGNIGEIISFASFELLESSLGLNFLEKYWKRRVSLRIPSRGIVPATEKTLAFFTDKKNRSELRQLKFIPTKKYPLRNEIDVYGNNVAIISSERGNEYGIIIRSETLAQSLRSVFELLWAALPDKMPKIGL